MKVLLCLSVRFQLVYYWLNVQLIESCLRQRIVGAKEERVLLYPLPPTPREMLTVFEIITCKMASKPELLRCLGAVPHQEQFFLQPHNIWTYRVVRKLPHTKFVTYSL